MIAVDLSSDDDSDQGGGPYPAASTAHASQSVGLLTVRLNLGCFNCGADQKMLAKDQETAGSLCSIPKRSGSAGSASPRRFRRFRLRRFRPIRRVQFQQVPVPPVRLHRASLPVPVKVGIRQFASSGSASSTSEPSGYRPTGSVRNFPEGRAPE